jgi:hypothetical protein
MYKLKQLQYELGIYLILAKQEKVDSNSLPKQLSINGKLSSHLLQDPNMRATILLPSRLPSDFSRGHHASRARVLLADSSGPTRASFILSRVHQIPKVLYSLAMLGAVADRACSYIGTVCSCRWVFSFVHMVL